MLEKIERVLKPMFYYALWCPLIGLTRIFDWKNREGHFLAHFVKNLGENFNQLLRGYFTIATGTLDYRYMVVTPHIYSLLCAGML